jgi:hypothetical protein
MKFRTFLLGAAALFVAFNAAFFSVTGLSKLFAGSMFAVILMASSLEFAKLIAASFLHSYWNKIGVLLKTYLTIGVVVLILITSGGIYGFLTSAYQATADKLEIVDKEAALIQLKVDRYQEQLDNLIDERNGLNTNISELSRGLSNNVVQYKDQTTGQILTSTSSGNRNAFQGQLNNATKRRDLISTQIEALTDSVTKLEVQILEIQSSNEDLAGEVGPLKFMAEATGKSMNTIVNWFALLIIFVFDPLAVTLVIAFNTALKIDKGEKEKKKIEKKGELYEVYGDSVMKGNPNTSLYDKEEAELWDNTIGDGLDDIPYEYDNVTESIEEEPVVEDSITVTEAPIEEAVIGETEDVLVETPEENPIEEQFIEEKKKKSRENIDTITKQKIEKARLEYENGGWRNAHKGQPYFMHPWFDWKKTSRWVNDRRAVQFWLKYKGGNITTLSKYTSNYPDDFSSKTY